MRLKCDVRLISTNLGLGQQQKQAKPVRGSVALGPPKKGAGFQLVVSNATNVSGLSLLVSHNIATYFEKFVAEGKLTIRFKEPSRDVQICNADPLLLKTFLTQLKAAEKGDVVSSTDLLTKTTTKHLEKPKTELIVTERREYPFSAGFPKSLVNLQVVGCSLNKVDKRLLQLRNLRCLDLSYNQFGPVLDELQMSCMNSLQDLRLTANGISRLSESFVSNLPSSITALRLDNNKLRLLPDRLFSQLPRLTILDVSQNQLTQFSLPVAACASLKKLVLANNRLRILPASICRSRMEAIDVSANAFLTAVNLQQEVALANSRANEFSTECPLLKELALRAICANSLQVDLLPPRLAAEVDAARPSFRPCAVCAKIALPSQACNGVFMFDLRKIAVTVCMDQTSGRSRYIVPVGGICCSSTCQERLNNGRLC